MAAFRRCNASGFTVCWFPLQLCRKDNLMKNVKKMKRQLERDGR